MILSDNANYQPRLKLLLIGDSKAGKTHYAMQVAEAGFTVFYIDGDVALGTLKQLSPAAQKRVYYLPVHDRQDSDGNYDPRFVNIVKEFITSGKFLWNSTISSLFDSATYEPHHQVHEIYPSRMNTNVVMIFDSWTTYSVSATQLKADSLGTDISEVEKITRELYAGVNNRATQTLTMLKASNCHVIVLAHPDEYIKTKNPENVLAGKVKEGEKIIEWTKQIPRSVSRPHGYNMAAHFTDVGWLELLGASRWISYQPVAGRISGGQAQTVRERVDKYSIADLIKFIGGSVPSEPDFSWLIQHGPGEYQTAAAKVLKQAGSSVSLGPKKGLAGLVNQTSE